MEKKVTAGSPISQNEGNVKPFFKEIFGVAPLSQNSENVKTFFEKFSLDSEITVEVIDNGVLLR
ncbi:MAG: hypothetical protein E7490_09120 [Ruminococcaceae bacterium]|nr:hypothetical protein [Oscillospiraceae bacterium]